MEQGMEGWRDDLLQPVARDFKGADNVPVTKLGCNRNIVRAEDFTWYLLKIYTMDCSCLGSL